MRRTIGKWVFAAWLAVVAGGCNDSSKKPATGEPPTGTPSGGNATAQNAVPPSTPGIPKVPVDAHSDSLGEPDVKLTADEFAAVQKDSKTAAGKFKGKVIELSGTAGSRYEESARGFGLSFQVGLDKEIGPSCFFKKVNIPERVLPGQTVRVRGRYTDLSSVTGDLEDGELVELGPDTTIRISAEELCKEYALNWQDAANKYHGRGLVVTGDVVDKKKQGDFRYFVTLKGHEGVNIVCDITTTNRETLDKKLGVGDKVKLTASFSSSTKYKADHVTLDDCYFQVK